MSLLGVLLLSASVSAVSCDVHFPPGFKFGAATAAYQIEGAWNLDGKGENIWDRITHTREFYFRDNKTGDVACDSYRLWRRDVQIAAELGLDFYRFSISWSRLLPSGFTNVVNEAAKKYYNDLIDGLLEKSIDPVVTLYHWDLPQRLQDLGGWTNPLVADWFTDYARLAYSLFGDRVKTWITINEPIVICDLAYSTGVIAPGIKDPVGAHLCNKNVLIAHAKAWRVYDEEFRAQFKGQVSLSNHLVWIEPASPGQEDIAELVRQDIVGRYSHPIYSKRGGWPPAVEKIIAENSKKEGFSRSKLPAFTEAEIELVKGTYDFYGFNQYTTRLARTLRPGEPKQPLPFGGDPEIGAMFSTHPDWEQTTTGWFYVYPPGLRRQLNWLKKEYGDIPILITENGYCEEAGDLNDNKRVQFYKDHLKEVLLAIEDGVNVTGYTAWSLMDNFEWWNGYRPKFGLYSVDFNSPDRTRSARDSARFYSQVIKFRSLNVTSNGLEYNLVPK